jgi:hypothetical protein
MEKDIAMAIFIAFEKGGQRQVIMDSQNSQAARCWNKFKTHCCTNNPIAKHPGITLETVPLIAEEPFRKLQILLNSLVKLLFHVHLSSPGKTADYKKFLVRQQEYKYNTLPTHNIQETIMAEEQTIFLLSDTFLIQTFAQSVRGQHSKYLLYGLDALGFGFNIMRTTFNIQLKNQEKEKLNALICSCELKQSVNFDTYVFQKDLENVLPVKGSPLFLISSKTGTKTDTGHILLSSTYEDGIITSEGLVLLTEDPKAEIFAKFSVGNFKMEDQTHRYNYNGTPYGSFPPYSKPTKDMLLKLRTDKGCKDNADFEMERYIHRLNDFTEHNDGKHITPQEFLSSIIPEIVNIQVFYTTNITGLKEINSEMNDLSPTGGEPPTGTPTGNSEAQGESDLHHENENVVESPQAQNESEQDNNVENSAGRTSTPCDGTGSPQTHHKEVETVVESIFGAAEVQQQALRRLYRVGEHIEYTAEEIALGNFIIRSARDFPDTPLGSLINAHSDPIVIVLRAKEENTVLANLILASPFNRPGLSINVNPLGQDSAAAGTGQSQAYKDSQNKFT